MYQVIKRLLDILIGIVAMPFLLIATILVGSAIKIEDGGPVFYRSRRIGKNSKIFGMIKFRSMVVDAPNYTNADGSTYNAPDDDRVTKVGRFIRKTSLDELPQFWNILIGEMSFIGPRASGAGALETYKEDEKPKMNVKPGLTGYSQAYYRNCISVREKRLYDAWYATHVTFFLDLKILCKTFKTVFSKENVYTNAEGTDKKTLWIDENNK